MKILAATLTYSGTQPQADACINTWISDIRQPHDHFFYGDESQSKKNSKTWICTPDEGEHRSRLPEKTYKMLKRSLEYDWDFLFKCDDDTFVRFDRLIEFLKNFDSSHDLYIGRKILSGPLSYAQGGAGYILTRSAVKKCLLELKKIYNDREINKRAEDYSVGLALQRLNIFLSHTDQLSTPRPDTARKDQNACINAIIKGKKITTHYVRPETMMEIYDLVKNKKT
jgi:hypothetical protein